MARLPNPYDRQSAYPLEYSATRPESAVISHFFNAVYAWMCAGMALTAVVAYFVSGRPDILMNIGRGTFLVLFIVQLILVGTISAAVQRVNAAVATVLFMLYAALNGVTLAGLFLVYTHAALASAFAVTAGMFGVMSLYGFLTRKDLTAMGSLLMMALVGLIIATVVSFFWHNTLLGVAINYIGVLIFVGLTAYDTQKLKVWAIQTAGNAALAARLSVSGALSLYLDFLNLFLFILRIMGDRR